MTRRDGICKTEKSLYMTSRLPHEWQVERPPMRTHAHAHTYTHVSTTCLSASQLQKLLETPHTPRPEWSCVHSAPLAPPFLGLLGHKAQRLGRLWSIPSKSTTPARLVHGNHGGPLSGIRRAVPVPHSPGTAMSSETHNAPPQPTQ